jgi:hypothetical protein
MPCGFSFASGARDQPTLHSSGRTPTWSSLQTICERVLLIRLTFLGRHPTKIAGWVAQSPKLGVTERIPEIFAARHRQNERR